LTIFLFIMFTKAKGDMINKFACQDVVRVDYKNIAL